MIIERMKPLSTELKVVIIMQKDCKIEIVSYDLLHKPSLQVWHILSSKTFFCPDLLTAEVDKTYMVSDIYYFIPPITMGLCLNSIYI